ncbi:hypothetical protein [Bacillus sp. FJAT-27245]|uniref:hypothetical protein n=1 Tax=Bacillus sp. FJAT-27245 TaxID=1684144 RepID=UPI0006A77CF2|nr:hypothetical protein [Bacillus sp. FJAT-27245]
MFKNKRVLPSFLVACAVHAGTFLYFFARMISDALDGSHRESFLDWVPLAVFLTTFVLQALPPLRSEWKEAPVKMFLWMVAVTAVLVWIFAFFMRLLT